MSFCPLEYRYGREHVRRILSDERKIEYMLRVEGELALAHARFGNIPRECAEKIASKCNLKDVPAEKVYEYEKKVKHDIMGLVLAITDACGPDAGRFVHLGATSNDIIDTAFALQMKEYIPILREDLEGVCAVLASLAEKYRKTVMVGRTHGQHALPITFGLKMCVYLEEFMRHIVRLDEITPRICVGKMMGAVGTGAGFGRDALKIQDAVMKSLGLSPEPCATQVVARDRHIELLSYISNVACTCERLAQEIRNLQRTEINEVREGFERRTQVGSSTMAQKMNPILSENICGLARVVRAYLTPMMESSILWHERDLTNSSAERIVVPHACLLIDDILSKTERLLRNLEVYPGNMRRNLHLTHGAIMAERVMIELTRRGMGRQEAHELIRDIMVNLEDKKDLKNELIRRIRDVIPPEEIDSLLNPETYLGASDDIIEASLKKWKRMRSKISSSKSETRGGE
jgi:adenylosuccinate lyase